MASTWPFNVYAGSETGLLKGINIEERGWQNLNSLAVASKSREILSLCWEDDRQSSVCAGLRDNSIVTFNADGTTKDEAVFENESGHIKAITRLNDHFITGFSSGVVKYWHGSAGGDGVSTLKTGDNLYAFAQSKSEPHIIATGGKENPLKLWNWNESVEPVFIAKNVRNDWLNLRVPVWVTRAAFLGDGRRVVTGSGYHQVRVYDPSSPRRRPVLDMTFKEHPVTGLAVRPDMELQVVVGNTHGDMGLLDLRKGMLVNLYKGFSGGITDIHCHQAVPFIVSCGIDRYVRVHSIETKELVHKFYMKSRLNCLLISDIWSEGLNNDSMCVKNNEITCSEMKIDKSSCRDIINSVRSVGGDDDGGDDLWNSLDVVKTKTVKKSAQKHKISAEEGSKVHNQPPKVKNKKTKRAQLQD